MVENCTSNNYVLVILCFTGIITMMLTLFLQEKHINPIPHPPVLQLAKMGKHYKAHPIKPYKLCVIAALCTNVAIL